jgi:hypothetical protein
MLLYILDFSALLDSVELEGNIDEPREPGKEVIDLSDYTLRDFCAMIFALPLLVLTQLWHLLEWCCGFMHFCSVCGSTAGRGGSSTFERLGRATSKFWKNVRCIRVSQYVHWWLLMSFSGNKLCVNEENLQQQLHRLRSLWLPRGLN